MTNQRVRESTRVSDRQTQPLSASVRPSVRTQVARAAVIGTLCSISIVLEYLLYLSARQIPPLWLEAGVALTLIALVGGRYWPALFISGSLTHWLILHYWLGKPLLATFLAGHLIAAGITGGTLLTLWLISSERRGLARWRRLDHNLLPMIAPFGGYSIAALLWTVARRLLEPGTGDPNELYRLWIGAAVASIVMVPFIFAVVNHEYEGRFDSDRLETVAYLIALGVLAVLGFGPFFDHLTSQVFLLLAVPLLMGVGPRTPPLLSALGVIGTALLSLWSFVTHQGYFDTPLPTPLPVTLLLAVGLVVLSATAMSVAWLRLDRYASATTVQRLQAGFQERMNRRTVGLVKATLALRLQNWERQQSEEVIEKLNEQLAVQNRLLKRTNRVLRAEIQSRQNVEHRLRENEEKYRLLFSNESNAIALFDAASGELVDVNEAWLHLYGYEASDAIGMAVENVGLFKPGIHSLNSMIPLRIQIRRDGSRFPAEVTLSSFMLQGRPMICSVTRDITEREATARALYESERRQRALLDALPDQMLRIAVSGEVLYHKVGEDDPLVVHHQGDKPLLISDLLPQAQSHLYLEALRTALATSAIQTFEYDLPLDDGTTRHLEARVVASTEDEVVAITRDITVWRNAEEQQRLLERRFLEAQKLESLGILAGGVAHDFNNLLTPIVSNASLILDEVGEESPIRSPVQEILSMGQQAADLTRQMLAYAGKGRITLQAVDINELIGQMQSLWRASINKNIALHLDLEATLSPIHGDEVQIRQILMNLVLNASEAVDPQGGAIWVTTCTHRCDAATVAAAHMDTLAPGDLYVEVEVRDNGIGMDDETIARIFEPFFTTKFTGRGLGLAAVYGIIRSHGGGLIVTSTPGEGTTFRLLFLPTTAGKKSLATPAALPRVAEPHGSRGQILVVDDELMVCKVTERLLERLGFSTIGFTDSRGALDEFRARPDAYQAVVLDVTMPHLNGYQLANALHGLRAELPIILTSGFSQDEAIEQVGQGRPITILPKPFDLGHLQRAMAAIRPAPPAAGNEASA